MALSSEEHLAARSAYERLFGDGLGLEGGEPMTWEIFQERDSDGNPWSSERLVS